MNMKKSKTKLYKSVKQSHSIEPLASPIKSVVYVLIPVYKAKYTFNTERNTSWGAIDKIFMDSLAQSSQTIEELVAASNLPRSLVLEIIIPFIREGWIHIKTESNSVRFALTERGKLVTQNPLHLPPKIVPGQITKHFLILQPTNQCLLHPKEWEKKGYNKILTEKGINQLNRNAHNVTRLRVIDYKEGKSNISWADIYRTLFSGDENVLGHKSSNAPLISDMLSMRNIRYMVAIVSPDEQITGIPDLVRDSLKDEILKAAIQYHEDTQGLGAFIPALAQHSTDIQFRVDNYPELYIEPNRVQLILGAEEHKSLFFDAIEQTQSWLIIHSTFINFSDNHNSGLSEIKERIYSLLWSKPYARVDIFWGMTATDDPGEDTINRQEQSQAAVTAFKSWKKEVESKGLSNRLILHIESTNSHAKFLIYDHVQLGPTVTIGSCNWLSTGFHRHETSVCIANPAACAEVLTILTRLMGQKINTTLESNQAMSLWASKLFKYDNKNLSDEEKMARTRVRFVDPSQHYNALILAREDVQYRLALCSHRVAKVGTLTILDTLVALKKTKPAVEISIYYSKREEDLKGLEDQFDGKCRDAKITLSRLKTPHAHSKFVCWDDDHVMITSQNWLSVQLSPTTREREFGVLLDGKNLATQLFNSIESFADGK